jgi:type IX secretion system PorP/SprF family membrane protein
VKNRPLLYTVVLAILFVNARAQNFSSSTPVRNYYYDYKVSNPAFTGTNATHSITSAYAADEGGSFSFSELAYGSYELNVKSIQSGVGIISSIQEVGITRFTDYGLLYSKKLALNETRGFYVGTQLTHQRRRLDYSLLQPLYPNDPIIGQGNLEKVSSFDFALGIAYYSPQVTLGVACKNILEQDITTREFNFLATRDFTVTKSIKATPSLLLATDFDYNTLRLNSSFELFKWVLLGAGYTFPRNGRDNLDLNIGVNIKDRVQIITHLFASEYTRFRRYDSEAFSIDTMIRVRIGDLKEDTK